MPFPFLELPPELRFHVYAIITIPRDAPFSAYSGVYLSCKQIKAEIDQEGAKATKSYLAYLTSIIPNIAISSTKSPASLSNLHLTLSPVFYATLTSVPSTLILDQFSAYIPLRSASPSYPEPGKKMLSGVRPRE
jgi:hypothetical protein